jgi:hypothetical protein
MFADPLSITYNAVAKSLAKVNQDGGGSDYFLDDTALTETKFRLSVRHTIPARGQAGESHLIRLDAERYPAGVYTRMDSAWFVAKSFDTAQSITSHHYLANALVGALTSANVLKLLSREN